MKVSTPKNFISQSVESMATGSSSLSLSMENLQALDVHSRSSLTSGASTTTAYDSSTASESITTISASSIYNSGGDRKNTNSATEEIEDDLDYLMAQFRPKTMEELKAITAIKKRARDRRQLAEAESQHSSPAQVQPDQEASQFLFLTADTSQSNSNLPTTATTSEPLENSSFLVLTANFSTSTSTSTDTEEQEVEQPQQCPCPRYNGRVYNVNHDTRQCIKENTRRKNRTAWVDSLPVGAWISVKDDRGHYSYTQKTLGDYYWAGGRCGTLASGWWLGLEWSYGDTELKFLDTGWLVYGVGGEYLGNEWISGIWIQVWIRDGLLTTSRDSPQAGDLGWNGVWGYGMTVYHIHGEYLGDEWISEAYEIE